MAKVIQMKSASGKGFKILKYEDDILLPNLVDLDPAATVKMTRELSCRSGDILVCSYHKCGANWLTSILRKMKTFDHSKPIAFTFLEFGSLDQFEALESPRILCNHLLPNRLPIGHIQNNGKIILLLRNPKDVVVSYYHHYKNAKVMLNKQTFDEFFASYTSGSIPWGSFFDYLAKWESVLKDKMAGRNNLHIEVFFYEDLKNDYIGNLERLNRFLGFGRDRSYLERIVAETNIDALREEISRLSSHPAALLDESGKSVIFRKGIIGDWKNHFNVAQSEEIDRLMKERHPIGMFHFVYE